MTWLYRRLWLAEKVTTGELRGEVAALRRQLAEARSAAAGWEAHHALACGQRERARDLAAALANEAEWTVADENWLRTLGRGGAS